MTWPIGWKKLEISSFLCQCRKKTWGNCQPSNPSCNHNWRKINLSHTLVSLSQDTKKVLTKLLFSTTHLLIKNFFGPNLSKKQKWHRFFFSFWVSVIHRFMPSEIGFMLDNFVLHTKNIFFAAVSVFSHWSVLEKLLITSLVDIYFKDEFSHYFWHFCTQWCKKLHIAMSIYQRTYL